MLPRLLHDFLAFWIPLNFFSHNYIENRNQKTPTSIHPEQNNYNFTNKKPCWSLSFLFKLVWNSPQFYERYLRECFNSTHYSSGRWSILTWNHKVRAVAHHAETHSLRNGKFTCHPEGSTSVSWKTRSQGGSRITNKQTSSTAITNPSAPWMDRRVSQCSWA